MNRTSNIAAFARERGHEPRDLLRGGGAFSHASEILSIDPERMRKLAIEALVAPVRLRLSRARERPAIGKAPNNE